MGGNSRKPAVLCAVLKKLGEGVRERTHAGVEEPLPDEMSVLLRKLCDKRTS